MTLTPPTPTPATRSGQRRLPRIAAAGLTLAMLFTSCASADGAVSAVVDGESASAISVDVAQTGAADGTAAALFDSSVVHDMDISFDQADYDEMIEIFTTTAEKEWIEVTITIDGTTFENAGMRLKGNSSLFGLTTDTAENPEDLPWLIRLDKYVDDQEYQGLTDIVIRSTSSETAMNEAVAQDLLALTGLANQDAIATAFTVNGGETELRLAMEHPEDIWADANFDDEDGVLYKADSTGDYSYRGEDPDAYDDVFNQKAGEDDLDPLIDFLDFINNSDDATFAAELSDHLDVDAFATYLAFQNLVSNADDIDGRGNNSYLHYDTETEIMTVVNWDLNLAFGQANVGGGGGAAPGDAAQGGGVRPERPEGAGGGPGAGAATGSNVLMDRFMSNADFAALYDAQIDNLTEVLFESGAFEDTVNTWNAVLTEGASSLVDAGTIQAEADVLLSYVAPSA